MFNSQDTTQIFKCGHGMHTECFAEYIKTNYKCLKCSKSLANMSEYFKLLDKEIEINVMPDEYIKIINIRCNDCENQSETDFHFIGLKCGICNSYNTYQI